MMRLEVNYLVIATHIMIFLILNYLIIAPPTLKCIKSWIVQASVTSWNFRKKMSKNWNFHECDVMEFPKLNIILVLCFLTQID